MLRQHTQRKTSVKQTHMSWKYLLCPLASITCNLFLLSLINEHNAMALFFCAADHSLLQKVFGKKQMQTPALHGSAQQCNTRSILSWSQSYRKNTLLLLREGRCNPRASCHKLLALLQPSGQEMTRVKQVLMVKNISIWEIFISNFKWSGYCNEFGERAVLVILHQEMLQFYCNLSTAHFYI